MQDAQKALTVQLDLTTLPTKRCGQCLWIDKKYKGMSCRDHGHMDLTDGCKNWEPDWQHLSEGMSTLLETISKFSPGQCQMLQWALNVQNEHTSMKTNLRIGDVVQYELDGQVLVGNVRRLWKEKDGEFALMVTKSGQTCTGETSVFKSVQVTLKGEENNNG